VTQPPGSDRLDRFVGRGELLDLVNDRLRGNGTSMIDCEGEAGIGKSQLLARIHRDALAAGMRVAWLRVERRESSTNSDAQLATDSEQFRELVKGIGTQLLKGKDLAEFEKAVSARALDPVQMQELHMSGFFVGTRVVQSQRARDITFLRQLHRSRIAMGADLAKRIRSFAEHERAVVLVDNYHNVMGNRRLRRWLAWLLQDVVLQHQVAAGVLVVVFRRPATEPLFADGWTVERRLLPLLERDEVEEYLGHRLRADDELRSDPAGLSRVLDGVMAFSNGHPLAMEAAIERVRTRRPGEALRVTLDSLSLSGQRQIADLVEQMVPSADRPRLRRVLEAACTLRRFDDEALAAVLDQGDRDQAAGDGGSLAGALAGHSFVTRQRDWPGRTRTYAIHEFVRQQKLDQLDEGRLTELHARAEAHYLGRARDRESELGGSNYARCLRYERREWQAARSEWLYHYCQGGERHEVPMEIATVYLEVFWWWGCYIRFPFCDLLVGDLVNHARSETQRSWAHALQQFHRAYAPEQGNGEGDWPAVEAALLDIRDLGGSSSPAGQLDETQQRLHALTAIFLAHAHWRQDVGDPQIDHWYREAYRRFVRMGEYDWCMPWVRFERADLERERGNPAAAARHCAAGLRLASADDHEVTANLRRLRADLALAERDVDQAAEGYALAVLEAYAFQYRPHPPDVYTSTFYEVVTSGILDQLRAVAEAGRPEEVVIMAERLHGQWPQMRSGAVEDWPHPVERLVEQGDWDALHPCLFPRGPSERELDGAAARTYAGTVSRHVDRARRERRRLGRGASA
jgi:hypothetical protein